MISLTRSIAGADTPRHRDVRGASAACLLMLCALAGCGLVPTDEPEPSARPPSKVEKAERYLDEVAAMPALDLADAERPAAPKGYDDADVDQLVRDATDVLERSIDPRLSAMTPDEAVDLVLAKQYDETRQSLFDAAEGVSVGWQWVVASRPAAGRAGMPKVVDLRSEASTESFRGGPDRFLTVRVQAFVVQRFEGPDGPRVTVVRRTVSLSSWDPLGGPDSWPWLGLGAASFGAEFCSLPTSASIEPAASDRELVEAATGLRRALSASGVDSVGDAAEVNRRYEQESRACATA